MKRAMLTVVLAGFVTGCAAKSQPQAFGLENSQMANVEWVSVKLANGQCAKLRIVTPRLREDKVPDGQVAPPLAPVRSTIVIEPLPSCK